MTTFKIEAALEGFFLMLNRAAQDPRLSADALAVLTYLHSLPPNWKIAIDGIQRHFSMKEKSANSVEVPQNYQAMGRDRTRQAINLLRELGYITRVKTSSTTYEYLVYAAADLNPNPESGVKVACPQKPAKVGSPDSDIKVGSPEVGSPEVGSPEVGSPDAITKQIDLQNKDLKKTHTSTKSATKVEAQWMSFPEPVEQECHQLVSKNALPSFDQVSSLIPVYADYVAYLAWIKKDSESWANNWQAFARKQVQDLVRGSGNSTFPRWKAGELPGQAANSPQKTGLSRDQINAIFDEIDGAA
jgi:hypothetical protein